MRSDEGRASPSHYGCLMISVILLFLALIAVALFWRSAWWEEAGAPIPRGTERLAPASTHAHLA